MGRARDLYNRISLGGYETVAQMIANRETEELFLDYKRSANNGNSTSLDNSDKANLSKAVSGFANSEGGVIIWGVDCRTGRTNPGDGDVPQQALPVTNATRFKSLLENAVSGATVPAHNGVLHTALPGPDGVNGFVVTLIPKGNHLPYQAVSDLSFKMRAGSNFVPVPRAVLAGMFGNFPQAEIQFVFTNSRPPRKGLQLINLQIAVVLRNVGMGIASDVYLNILALSAGGTKSKITFEPQYKDRWTHTSDMEKIWTSVLKLDERLPPEGFVLPVVLDLDLRAPFDQDFTVNISAGAKGAAPTRAVLKITANELSHWYATEFVKSDIEDNFAFSFSELLMKCIGNTRS